MAAIISNWISYDTCYIDCWQNKLGLNPWVGTPVEPAQGDMGDSTGKTPPYTGKRVGTHAELTKDFTLTVNPWFYYPFSTYRFTPYWITLTNRITYTGSGYRGHPRPVSRKNWTELNWTDTMDLVTGSLEIRVLYGWVVGILSRNNFVYAPSQWETTLHCNIVSHWLDTYTKWSLFEAIWGLFHKNEILPVQEVLLWRLDSLIGFILDLNFWSKVHYMVDH